MSCVVSSHFESPTNERCRTALTWSVLALVMLLALAPAAQAGASAQRSITDTSLHLPGWLQILRVASLRDYNTRVVVIGTTLLGLAAGIIGTFMLLRKRALLGDALSHATLPGIGVAFIVAATLGAAGKSLPVLLLGAMISGVIGVCCILAIVHLTRIKEDTALGIVLSIFFGLGIAVLGVVQKMDTGSAAGLESFIYGKTASMVARDAWLIGGVAAVIALACVLLFKEFSLLCFDAGYSSSQGWPVVLLDVVMMGLAGAVAVVGLQAVGLILIIALLVTPPAAARFWTEHLPWMVIISAAIGAASGLIGAMMSALQPRLPAGAIIVVVAGLIFVVSMLFGRRRGIVVHQWRQRALSRKVARQHMLRAMFEWLETAHPVAVEAAAVPLNALLARRAWSAGALQRILAGAARAGLVRRAGVGAYSLTAAGLDEARRMVRNHRLWELFLLTYADVATSQVDRDADRVEHVLGPEMIAELEGLLAIEHPHVVMPVSPHALANGRGGAP